MAKRLLYICSVLLVLSIGLLGWIAYDCLKGAAEMHHIASSLINVALFSTLILRSRKIVKEYEQNV